MTPPGRPLVTLDDVDVLLADAPVLQGVSFTLREGESWAVLGGNGAGKSTFLRLLRGDVWPHPRSRGERLYHFPGEPSPSHIGARERMPLVSPEGQDAYVRRDWELPVVDVVRSGFFDAVWPPEPTTPAQEERVRAALALVGLAGHAGRSILELSAGEMRRALLARALAPGPRALLLDEFAGGLDRQGREALLAAVSAAARGGTPVLMTTHRPEELIPEIARAVVLEGGRVVEEGGREEVLAQWIGRARSAAAAQGTARPPAARREDSPAPPERSERGALAKSKGESTHHPPFDPAPPLKAGRHAEGQRQDATAADPAPLLELRRAEVRVEGRRVLGPLDWRMRPGESWVVHGPNGSGKTTFLRLLLGELQPAPGGEVRRRGFPARTSVFEVKERIGFVGPLLQAEHRFDATGEEVVLSGFFGSVGLPEEPAPDQRAAAARWMDRLGVAALARRHIHALSYGEVRKLLLCRAMVRDPRILLLDEPASGLDAPSRGAFLALLEALCRAGTQLVVASHHDDELVPAVGHELVLDGGRVVRQGPRGG